MYFNIASKNNNELTKKFTYDEYLLYAEKYGVSSFDKKAREALTTGKLNYPIYFIDEAYHNAINFQADYLDNENNAEVVLFGDNNNVVMHALVKCISLLSNYTKEINVDISSLYVDHKESLKGKDEYDINILANIYRKFIEYLENVVGVNNVNELVNEVNINFDIDDSDLVDAFMEHDYDISISGQRAYKTVTKENIR